MVSMRGMGRGVFPTVVLPVGHRCLCRSRVVSVCLVRMDVSGHASSRMMEAWDVDLRHVSRSLARDRYGALYNPTSVGSVSFGDLLNGLLHWMEGQP